MSFKIKSYIIPIGLFLLSLSIYWITANPFPSGYADSDELIVTGYLFSVAHPPGYALNSILVGLFQRLIFWLSPAHASNLFAGLLSSSTLLIVYLSIMRLIKHLNSRRTLDYWSQAGIAFGVIIVGLSGLYWLYSTIIEVFSFGNLLCSLMIYYAILWLTQNRHNDKFLFVTSTLFGLGVSHLQSISVYGPGLLYLFITHNSSYKQVAPKLISILLIVVSSFLIGNTLIIPLNQRHQSYSWDFKESLNGWWGMITRKDYQGYIAEKNITIENAYIGSFSKDQIRTIPIYLATMWNQFAGPSLLLSIVGLYYFYKKDRSTAIGFFILFLVTGLLFGSYTTTLSNNTDPQSFKLIAGTAHRQYLLSFVILAIFSGIGGFAMVEIISNIFKTKIFKQISIITCICLPLASVLMTNWTMGDQRDNDTIYNYNHNMLEVADPNSVIICSGDFACFGLYYQSLVEKFRPDVVILSKITRARHYFLKDNPRYIGFEYPENPFFYAQALSWNVSHRPTYVTTLDPFYVEYIGLNGNPFFVIPNGYLFKVESKYPKAIYPSVKDTILDEYLVKKRDERDFMRSGIQDYLASNLQLKASLDNWLRNVDSNIREFDYLKEATSLYEKGEIKQAYEKARIASYVHPTSVEPLILLKSIYRSGNYTDFETLTQMHIDFLQSATLK